MNKRIMEFIAVDLQPLSVVENIGFERFVKEMQPKYVMPGRKFFTNTLMPQIVESIKAIWDGIRKMSDDESLESVLGRIKKFIRKFRKSKVLRDKFEGLQKLMDLPPRTLVKDTEVRWSSTFQMLDRFLQNKTIVGLLCAEDISFPNFSADDWRIISALKQERTFDDDVQNYPDAADEISNNLFTEFEQEMNLDNFLLASPIPSPAVLNARQKSEAK
ncbi:hypothetical protein niasHT_018520 [Heterodera trifolii]|uniref:Uncharacterized protein n=1 Tax=Heterodera trifolii TaxID=157864 RepID=A0ABD2LB31_9BILA